MKKVLFLCVGNSCRSQMAEGFARHYGRGIIAPHSAGTIPASSISSTAIQVMAENGIDISGQRPKALSDLENYDILISMGCGVEESCPVMYLQNFIEWGLDDPVGQPVEKYRQVRDEIERRVLELIELYLE